MKNMIVVNGPNLNLLGEREPEVYGTLTLAGLNQVVHKHAEKCGFTVKCFQSNHEGGMIDYIHENRKWADGIILNAGALTHYSYALRDAIASVDLPTVEVHLSDIHKREEFRRHSVLEEVCERQICGLKEVGYFRAIEYLRGLGTLAELECSESASRDDALKDAVRVLDRNFAKYNWVGIYMKKDSELVLHNYLGRPTPHMRIPMGKGICGAAVAEQRTILVPDVSADSRYLACNVETKSEIVTPMFLDEEVIGEIDIDSDMPNAFHDGDRELLEEFSSRLIAKWRLLA